MKNIIITLLVSFTLLATVLGVVKAGEQVVRLATTTSTENSGLLNILIPPYEKLSGQQVHVIAVGTGKAMRHAREGDVDVVFVHARDAEDELVEQGYGVNRRDVMFNDFVIVGPATDPADIRGENAVSALKKIADSRSVFVSRGDNSGTHKKEMELWAAVGISPKGSWYREAGQGMGKVLQMAGELDAYTLTDRGTWIAFALRIPLQILIQGEKSLFNPYGIIAVNPDKYPDVNYLGAMGLIAWVTSPRGQQLISDFKIAGKQLFIPAAIVTK